MFAGICPYRNVVPSRSTRASGDWAEASPRALALLIFKLSPQSAFAATRSAKLMRAATEAVFSMPNSGAFMLVCGIT